MSVDDIDVYEVNEAFGSVPVAFAKELGVDEERLNVHGGAIALGHPLGGSGTKLMTHWFMRSSAKAGNTACKPCARAVAWQMSRLLKTFNKPCPVKDKTPPLGGVFLWSDRFRRRLNDLVDVIDKMTLPICSSHCVALHFADKDCVVHPGQRRIIGFNDRIGCEIHFRAVISSPLPFLAQHRR